MASITDADRPEELVSLKGPPGSLSHGDKSLLLPWIIEKEPEDGKKLPKLSSKFSSNGAVSIGVKLGEKGVSP